MKDVVFEMCIYGDLKRISLFCTFVKTLINATYERIVISHPESDNNLISIKSNKLLSPQGNTLYLAQTGFPSYIIIKLNEIENRLLSWHLEVLSYYWRLFCKCILGIPNNQSCG